MLHSAVIHFLIASQKTITCTMRHLYLIKITMVLKPYYHFVELNIRHFIQYQIESFSTQ